MTGTSRSRMNPPANPTKLSVSERKYYRAVWGFDPITDCYRLDDAWNRYEACVPLARDPPLDAVGVTICARVEWHGEEVHNRILAPIFRFRDLFMKDPNRFLDWVQAWKENASIPLLSNGMGKDLRDIILQEWETIVRTWPSVLFTELCHSSDILDGLQNFLFGKDVHLTRAREIGPDKPWDSLLHEWEARMFFYEFASRLDTDSDEWGGEQKDLLKMPPYEIWPRGPLCSVYY